MKNEGCVKSGAKLGLCRRFVFNTTKTKVNVTDCPAQTPDLTATDHQIWRSLRDSLKKNGLRLIRRHV